MENAKKVAFLILAVIAGYAIMVIGLFISQDAFFGGIVIGETKIWELAIAGVGAFLSAFAGGYTAQKFSPFRNWIAPFIIGAETIVESIYLFRSGKFPNPLWFDIGAEFTLLFGIFCGAYFYMKKT